MRRGTSYIAPIVIISTVLFSLLAAYYFNAKLKYFDNDIITLITETKIYQEDKKTSARSGYEIEYRPKSGKCEIIQYNDDYYEIVDSSDWSETEYEKLRKRLPTLTALLLLDYADRVGVNDSGEINNSLVKHTPFDKNCYWADIITESNISGSIHKQKKGTQPSDIGGLNVIMGIVYYFNLYFVYIFIAAVGMAVICYKYKKKQAK